MTGSPASVGRQWTVLELLEWTAGHLSAKGFDEARLTVDLLLAHVLRLRRLDLYLQFDRILLPQELGAFRGLYERRLTHEPLQYILGETEFMGLKLKLGRAALIPRPETEHLVEHAVAAAAGLGEGDLQILDIGTGSGNVALAIAQRLPKAHVTSIDVSGQALLLAARNAADNGIATVTFLEADIFGSHVDDRLFDLIVSNPPYVSAEEYACLEPEVRDFEPRLAVTDGGDGFRFHARIAERARALLRRGGMVLVEIGYRQAEGVCEILGREGFGNIVIHRDYAEIKRVISAVQP